MNRYFWLLMRFIGDEHGPEDRRAIYDRAREALLQQLVEGDGEASPSSAYERLAFEEAIRTVEASIARWGRHGQEASEAS